MADNWFYQAKRICWRIIKYTPHVIITLVAIILACLWYYINYCHGDFDERLVQEFLNYKSPLITEILYRNGETMMKFPGIGDWNKRVPEYRVWVKYEDIPPLMRQAILAAEDQRFFEHNGLDYWPGMARALGENIIQSGRVSVHAGKLRLSFAQGASTLTQQGVELTLFRDSHERELRGELSKFEKFKIKIDKMRMAVWLEEELQSQLGKEEAKKKIFEIVANISYCGQGQYGIVAAANFIFGKKLGKLTPPEAATIAALFRSPERYSPYRNSLAAMARRNGILKIMSVWKYIEPNDLPKYYSEQFNLAKHGAHKTEAPAAAQYVTRELWSQGTKSLHWENGVKIISTVDRSAQLIANSSVSYGLKLFKDRQMSHADEATFDLDRAFFESRAKGVQAALVVMQNGTGEVLAMVGGAANDFTSFNRAVDARRQPGSSFKPIVYGTAIEQGPDVFRIDCSREGKGDCLISDASISVKMGRHKPRHHIKNYDGRVFGRIPVWVALARSQNMAAMHLAERVGLDNVLDFANRVGLYIGMQHAYPTMAIGANEVTLLNQTAAYSAFATYGVYAEPHILRQVVNSNNESTEYRPKLRQAIDPNSDETLAELLRHPVIYKSGTARSFNENGGSAIPIAGKTGTSNAYRDAWFCAFTYGLEGITACSWVGMDDRTPLATDSSMGWVLNPNQKCRPLHTVKREYCEAGGKTALPIIRRFMKDYYKGQNKTPPQFPEEIDARAHYAEEHDYDPTSARPTKRKPTAD